jgi:cell wall-associated NlpC family hydrolase
MSTVTPLRRRPSRGRIALGLGLAVALAGCSAVQPSTRTPGPSTTSGRSDADRDGKSRRIVEIALKHVGTPYRWGGASPGGFDCSGLVRYVYGQVGVALPHNAAQQYRHGRPVSRAELRPGDLVFFDRLRHNGIYVGNGEFVHARQSGRHVGVARLDDDWYDTRWVGARRL